MKGDPVVDERKLETVMSGKAQKGRAAATLAGGGGRACAFRVVTPADLRLGPDKPARL